MEYGKNLSKMFVSFLNNLTGMAHPPPEKDTTQYSSTKEKPEQEIQIPAEIQTSVKTAFADITSDNTFIADIGRAFAANATRLRYEQLRLKHPGYDAQIRAAIKHDHAELARLSRLDENQ